jgi:putative acetyltransferase
VNLDFYQNFNLHNSCEQYKTTTLQKEDVLIFYNLIKKHIEEYDKNHRTLITTFKRIDNLYHNYTQSGNKLFIIKNFNLSPIACSGIGSFRGLHPSEGIGEIRDLVVEPMYRNQGLGEKIFRQCLNFARSYGYHRLYLEITPQMQIAQKLFLRKGFKPVKQLPEDKTDNKVHSYYVLENLSTNYI